MRLPVLALSLCAALAACGNGNTGPDDGDIPAELVAVWVAEPACLPQCGFTVFPRAQPADSINLVQFGLGVEMNVQATGRLTIQVSLVRDTLLDGRLEVRGGQLLVSATGSPTVDTLDYSISGAILNMQLRSQISFDLNGDGSDEPVGLRGAFRRR